MVEEKLGGSVDRQHEEQLLQVNSRAILRNVFEHEFEVALEGFEISNLVSSKIGSQEMTAICPALAISVEDAMTHQRRHCCRSDTETVILELQAQYCLNVLRLARGNH